VTFERAGSILGRDVISPYWLAPEVMKGLEYSSPGDVYSFGIILWELYTRQHPFDEFNIKFMHQLEHKIMDEDLRPTIPQNCLSEYADLVTSCWHPDPKSRPTFKFILTQLQYLQELIQFA